MTSEQSNQVIQFPLQSRLNFDNMSQASSMRKVVEMGRLVAPKDISVLIEGESGVGKEVMARAIHNDSSRHAGPFIAVNCGAIPRELVESILFGHTKGAFTGASKEAVGKFQQANRGTLFLDEIGELPLDVQVKVLRVIQERIVEKIGSDREEPVDIRIISATNRDLGQQVAKREFREDLFYRLNVFPIHIPALRERPEDVVAFSNRFLRENANNIGIKAVQGFTDAAQECLRNYQWPGNIRELQNTIAYAYVMSQGADIDATHLHPHVRENAFLPARSVAPAGGVYIIDTNTPDGNTLAEIRRAEDNAHLAALSIAGNPTAAAKLLGVTRTTFLSRIQKLRAQPT